MGAAQRVRRFLVVTGVALLTLVGIAAGPGHLTQSPVHINVAGLSWPTPPPPQSPVR